MPKIEYTANGSTEWIQITTDATAGTWSSDDIIGNSSQRPKHLEGKPHLAVPKHWPKNFNASSSPCDIMQGPCSCGAWHSEKDDWVKESLEKYGMELSPKDYKPVLKNGEYRWVLNS